MVGSGNKFGSALSWADEVELEEELVAAAAAAQAKEHSMWRQNPFGSARPREVVLEEKGIDWKRIDDNVQQSSHLRQEAIVTVPQEQHVSISSATINETHSNLPSRRPREQLEYSNLRFDETENFPLPQNQSAIVLVPPLRYPPKTVAGKPFAPEKENRFNALDRRNFYSLQRLNPRCHSNPRFDQKLLHSKNVYAVIGNGGTRSGLGKSKKAQNSDRNLKKAVSHNSTHPRTKFHGQSMVPPKSERGPLQIHDKRPAGKRDQTLFWRDYAESMVDRHLMNPSRVVTNQQKRHSHTDSGNNGTGKMVRIDTKEVPVMESAVSCANRSTLTHQGRSGRLFWRRYQER